MKICPRCGNQNEDSAAFCSNCGMTIGQNAAPAANFNQRPEHYPIGGLMAWSIITLLLCTIPGIVALVMTCNINNAFNWEQQQKQIKNAKTWCIVGTVLGCLSMLLVIIGALAA